MNAHLIRMLMILMIPLAIRAVVKIDISPVKEIKEAMDANATTVLPPTSTEAVTEATNSTSLPLAPIGNATLLPTQITTVNGSTALQNDSVPVNATVPIVPIVPIIPITMLNATTLALLPEYTIRMMRRRFTNYDYYCPCDLKVRFARIPFRN